MNVSHVGNLSYLYVNGSEGHDDCFLMSRTHVSYSSLSLGLLITYYKFNYRLMKLFSHLR